MRYRPRRAWGTAPLAHLIIFAGWFLGTLVVLVVLLNLVPRPRPLVLTDPAPAAQSQPEIFHKSRRPE